MNLLHIKIFTVFIILSQFIDFDNQKNNLT